MLDEAHILKDPSHPGSARISYRPQLNVLQKMLQSKHALQFSARYVKIALITFWVQNPLYNFRYDVDRRSDQAGAGEVQVVDGYFAHFVAPENLTPMAKHVIFVLDTSGSMEGKKMQQVKSALKSILSELRNNDYFSILQFSTDVTEWRPEATAASVQNVKEAKTYIEALQAVGGTNIHGGLRKALSRVQSQQAIAETEAMIIFLTDGHATSGITAKDEILMDIRSANAESNVPIFGLAFGRFADFDLLKVLSLQNYGFSRKIYIGQVSH